MDNALPPEMADALARSFPARQHFVRWRPVGHNQKLYLRASAASAARGFPEAWRAYLQESLDTDLARECLRIFGPHLRHEYPQHNFDHSSIAFRTDRPGGGESDLLLDSLLLTHTPSVVTGAERGPHIKLARSLVLGYLYVRPEADRAAGADDVLYAPRDGIRPALFGRQEASLADLTPAVTIPRRHNRLFLFLNTARSFQAPSPRSPSNVPLMSHHFVVHFHEPLFNLTFRSGSSPIPFDLRPSPVRAIRALASRVAGFVR